MPRIYETLFNQKNRFSEIREYYDIVKDECIKNFGVELLGFFRPQNEPWNWAYFIEVDSAETMQKIGDKIEARYFDKRENITQIFRRIYTNNFYNPKPENVDQGKYLQIELDVWEGVNIGLKEYHDSHVRVFEGQRGVWYQGQYRVWSEPYNWAHFYWFEDLKRMSEMSDASWRATGQPVIVPIINTRSYVRYAID